MMYLAVVGNRVVHHCESGYICVGSTLICEEENLTIENATMVNIGDEEVPSDISCGNYLYIHGEFVRATPRTLSEYGIVDAVSKNGDVMTGSLIVRGASKAIAHENPVHDLKVYMQSLQNEDGDNQAQIVYLEEGTEKNWIILTEDTTYIAKPIETESANFTKIVASLKASFTERVDVTNSESTAELHINKLGVNKGAAQQVDWVWSAELSRYVLCTVTE